MAILIDLAIKAAILIAAAAVVTALMWRASAASRHAVWTAAFAAALLLPVARLTLPALPIFVLAPEAPLPVAAPEQARLVLDADPIWTEPPVVRTLDADPIWTAPPAVQTLDAESTRPSQPWSLSDIVVGLWLAGASLILLKAAIGAGRARLLTRNAAPVTDAAMIDRLDDASRSFGVSRAIRLFIANRDWMPITWGIRRPTILLPACASTWSGGDERLGLVLSHEVAHIARWDAVSQIIARAAFAMYWFNPMMWLAVRRARLERERACDDAVLARGFKASDYASDLLVLAESLAPPSLAPSGALAMARKSQLDDRIRAILDSTINRRGTSRSSALVAVALVVAMLPVAAAKLAARPAEPVVTQPELMELVEVTPTLTPSQTPKPTPTPTPSPTPTPTPTPATGAEAFLSQEGKWNLARSQMLIELRRRAITHVENARKRIEIGTLGPIDTLELERAVTAVNIALGSEGGHNFAIESHIQAKLDFSRSDDQIATIRGSFARAIKELDAAEIRFDNGLLKSEDLKAATMAALAAVIGEAGAKAAETSARIAGDSRVWRAGSGAEPAPLQHGATGEMSRIFFVTRSGTNRLDDASRLKLLREIFSAAAPADSAIIEALKNVTAVKDETMRADTLILLAQRHGLTPDMVSLYVAAARGITSEAERTRVFAQPVRLKPGGGK